MLTDDAKLALETPADGDMAKIKEKSKLIIAMKGHARTKAYNLAPKVELGNLKTYVSNHNFNVSQATRRKNNEGSSWSFANGVRRQY